MYGARHLDTVRLLPHLNLGQNCPGVSVNAAAAVARVQYEHSSIGK